MSGIGREERYEPLRDPSANTDGSYKSNWDNMENQKIMPPKPVITWQYMFFVAAVVLFEAGFIAIFSIIMSTGKSWSQYSTGDKIWVIVAPAYTLVTIFVVGIFIRIWQKTRRINRA